MKDFTLKISGSITIGNDILIHQKVREVLEDGVDLIVFDMSGVTYMDSSAVGELVACYTSCKNREVPLALVALPAKIRKLMQTMCFLDIFDTFDTMDDARQIMCRRHEKKKG